MKQLSIVIFSLVVAFSGLRLIAPPSAHAQLNNKLDIVKSRAIAFVKTDLTGKSRSVLYIKRPGVPVDEYDIVAIINQLANGGFEFDSIRHLSVIGMTPDGGHLVLGGQVFYIDPSSSSPASFSGIFRLPWPLNTTTIQNDLPFDFNSGKARWFLQAAPDLGSFHPTGILSADGTRWYAAMRTSSPGAQPMTFYSGLVNGSGTVDSATVTAEVAGNTSAPSNAWIESTIALDTTTHPTNTMLVAEVDALESFGNQSERYLMIHWTPGGNNSIYAQDMSGAIKGMSGRIQFGIDSLFAVTVVPAQDGQDVSIGLQYLGGTSDTNHSIQYYTDQYNSSVTSLTSTNLSIPASILPDKSFTFFAGENTNTRDANNNVIPVYSDDNSTFHEHGQSGDIIVTNDQKTALFITHEHPQDLNTGPGSPRNVKSAVFSYDFGGGKAQMLYDDSNAQELQPVFVIATDTIPHVPGLTVNPNSIDFGPVDTATTSSPKTVTVTDTSSFEGTYIDSVKIIGDAEFTVTSPTTFRQTVQPNGNLQIGLQFAPVGAAGVRNAKLIIYSSLSNNKMDTVSLTGSAKVKQAKGVKEDPTLAQNVFVNPNPFSSIATVRLIAPEAASLGIIVHDALGRVVYTSPVLHAGAGESESFEFDAKSLGLPNGVYYVTALFGERQITQHVMLTR